MPPTPLVVRALPLGMLTALALPACGGDEKTSAAPTKSAITETCEADFCIVATRGTGRIDVDLRAESSAEITATLTFTLTNLTGTVPLPLTTSAKGALEKRLVTLTPPDAAAAYSYKFDYTWGYGIPGATHDPDTVYRLPYATGTAFPVVQGYDGEFSHMGEDQYAVDFAMPIGTPVYAARAGKVLAVEESFDAGGTDASLRDKANAVKISHADGTVGEYLHFEKNGVTVAKGDDVGIGQLLGTSGNTGFSSGPHLHFKVSRRIDGATSESLRIKYKPDGAAATELEEGKSYTAAEVP